MKINWKVRIRNKTWLAAFIALVVSFVYDLLAAFGIVPTVSKDWVMSTAKTALTLLTALGVLIDPTTPGASDSERAMGYVEPGKSE